MEYRIWFDEPAENNYNEWESRTLPIGNSSIGGNVFGRYDCERITLNEKSFWTGGPSSSRPDYRGGNLKDKGKHGKTLSQVQKLFLEGQIEEGEKLCSQLVGTAEGYGGYQLFGNLYLDFGDVKEAEIKEYFRELNIRNGIAAVGYKRGQTSYDREIFVSYEENVMVVHLTATGEEKVKLVLRMTPEQDEVAPRETIVQAQESSISMFGTLSDNQLKYSAFIKVLTDGVVECVKGTELAIEAGREVTILLSMATDYANVYPQYRTGETMEQLCAKVQKTVEAAAEKSYEELKAAHVLDMQSLMDRVRLDIRQKESGRTTDEALTAYKAGVLSKEEKAYLEVLLFQYGRYLLISSSRGNTLPANLQGIWVGKNGNPWGSDYHLNVNLQMNYWHAYNTNLAECALPLIDYVESLRKPGRVTAADYFGVESTEECPENGFTANTQATIFGWTCPGWSFDWGWSPAVVPWILQNVWEYYEYTLDERMLREKIYPMMKEQVNFYKQILVRDTEGKWISTPAFSPEHGPRTNGNTYEQTLIWQLFTDTIAAAKIVGEDPARIAVWEKILSELKSPVEIGTSGQIKEWYHETELGSVPKADAFGHRHLSHLLGLYPGDLIGADTPEWLEAARVSLDNRVDKSTGWAMGQRINSWARLGDGEHMYRLVETLLKEGILENLWDTHPPFQIDGNFGYTAGVTEALMQSNRGYIRLLPALPDAWADGSVEGIVARGNFVIGMKWKEKKPYEITVHSGNGGVCELRFPYGDKEEIKSVSMATEAGKEYTITV